MALQLDKSIVDAVRSDDDGFGAEDGGLGEVQPTLAKGLQAGTDSRGESSASGMQRPEPLVNSSVASQASQLRTLADSRAILLAKADHLNKGLATIGAEVIQDLDGFTNDEFEQELQAAATIPSASILTIGREVAQQQHALRLAGTEGDLAKLLPQSRPPLP